MLAYQWFSLTTGFGNYDFLREVLNMAWDTNTREQMAQLSSMRKSVLGPSPQVEDPQMFPGAAVAQNAVASVCYAVEAILTGDIQAPVWAARQLYEAADSVVQEEAAVQTYVTDIDREQPVRMILEGIAAALRDASSLNADDLRAEAEEDGGKFLGMLTVRS